MPRRLRNISEADFCRFVDFARDHPEVVKRAHALQKLIIFNFVAPIIDHYKPESMLEIGCGLGFHSALLTNYGRVFATELQVPGSFAVVDADAEHSRALVFKRLAKSEVRFTPNDGRRLPYPDQSFDLVFHNSVIEHVPDAVAFNRETARVLKPGGVVVCITGTPALCRFRFVRDYLLRLPLTLAAAFVREFGVAGRRSICDQIKALIPDNATLPLQVPSVSGLNPRLFHYVYSPIYNAMVLDEMAKSTGLDRDTVLFAAYRQLQKSVVSRLRYYLTPKTHGQHYRDFRHEMSQWRLDRWRETFNSAGLEVVDLVPYRYHHLFETTSNDSFNAWLFHQSAPLIERYARSLTPGFASECILVAQKT